MANQIQYPGKTTKTPLAQTPLGANAVGGGPGKRNGFFATLWAQLRGQSSTEVLGPGEPVQSYFNQDPSEGDAPRVIEYPYSSNILYKPRSEYPELTPFDQLRALSANYDVAQICQQTLKAEIAGLEWAIMPADAGDLDTQGLYKDEAKKAAEFLSKPDGDLDLQAWVGKLLTDDLEIGSPVVYKHRTRGGKLGALEQIQGDTMKPVIDYRGKPIAYQQAWRGLPGQVWKTDDIIYKPRIRRTNSVYGKSPLEFVLISVNTALRKQTYDLAYYQEGNIPDVFMPLDGDKWTVDQIKAFQAYWDDLLTGNDGKRRKVYFVPTDPSKAKEFRQQTSDTAQQMWLLYITCAAYGINPEELGFMMHAGKTASEMQAASQRRKGVTPIVSWVEQLLTGVVQDDLGYKNLMFKYKFNPNEQNVFQQAQADNLYLQNKVYDPSYIRKRDGVRLGQDSPILVEEKYRQDHPELAQPAGITPPNLAGAQQYPNIDPNAPGKTPAYPQVGPVDAQNRAQAQQDRAKGTYNGGPQKAPDGQNYAPGSPKSGDSGAKTAQNEKSSQKTVSQGQNDLTKADLRRWREKSLTKLREIHYADVTFASDYIPSDTAVLLHEGLATATTAEQVKAVFAAVL